jgi:cytochrome oxidase Cu insertion factor (SCO1/SenC/PrrC family)
MDPRDRRRRRRVATLTVVLPVLAGLVIAGLVHFLGHETTEVTKPEGEPQHRTLTEAAIPAATGSPAPRVRLEEPATGRSFDTAGLGDRPYAVVFVSTRCGPIGDYLRRAAADLGDAAAIVAITADPRVDTPAAVRAWLARHRVRAGDPLHYLVGDEDEVRGFWNAWGFNGPSAECPELVAAHLVAGSGQNTGVVDIDPSGSATLFAETLTGATEGSSG